jgi:hypothetical protein
MKILIPALLVVAQASAPAFARSARRAGRDARPTIRSAD